MKVSLINEQQFDNFSFNHKLTSYYQSSSYGILMSNHNLTPMYLGFYEGAKLIGASLILHKPSFFGFKYGYAPRGLLINYENSNQINDVTKELKNFLFKEKFILLKIDPLIPIYKKDKNGNIIKSNNNKDFIINSLKDAGFIHCGFNDYFESVKPRNIAMLDINKSHEEIFKKFNKSIKNKIRKSSKLGVEIYKDNSAIDKVYPFIAKKGNYSLKYYQDFVERFKDKVEIYLAKIDTEKHVENSRILYEKELEYNSYLHSIISRDGYKGKNMKDILNKKMNSDKLLVVYKEYLVNSITMLRNNPDGLIIAGTIIVKDNNKINLLIDGYDKMYGKFCPLYLTKWHIIKEYANKLQFFDLNGIVGKLDDAKYKGLNEMKFGFNATRYEYIGEFNLIVNNPIYALYKSLILEDSIKNVNKRV